MIATKGNKLSAPAVGLSYWLKDFKRLRAAFKAATLPLPPLLELTLNDRPFSDQELSEIDPEKFPDTRFIFHTYHLNLGGPEIDLNALPRARSVVEQLNSPWYAEDICFESFGPCPIPHMGPPYLPHPKLMAPFCQRIEQLKKSLARPILLEHTPTILPLKGHGILRSFSFLSEAALQTGSGLLMDLGHLYTIAKNFQLSFEDIVDSYALDLVVEIHLAGVSQQKSATGTLYLDDHSVPPPELLVDFLKQAIEQGRFPNLEAVILESYDLPIEQYLSCYQKLSDKLGQLPKIKEEVLTSNACPVPEAGQLFNKQIHALYSGLFFHKELIDSFFEGVLEQRYPSSWPFPIPSTEEIEYFGQLNPSGWFSNVADMRRRYLEQVIYISPFQYALLNKSLSISLDKFVDTHLEVTFASPTRDSNNQFLKLLSPCEYEVFRCWGGIHMLNSFAFFNKFWARKSSLMDWSASAPALWPIEIWAGLLDYGRIRTLLGHRPTLKKKMLENPEFSYWENLFQLLISKGFASCDESGLISWQGPFNMVQLTQQLLDPEADVYLERNQNPNCLLRFELRAQSGSEYPTLGHVDSTPS